MISKNLKTLRQFKGFNQSVVADYLNMSVHSYCNKENGKHGFTLNEAKKIADLYGLTIDDVFFKPIVNTMNT